MIVETESIMRIFASILSPVTILAMKRKKKKPNLMDTAAVAEVKIMSILLCEMNFTVQNGTSNGNSMDR